jgi:hypothetical protein
MAQIINIPIALEFRPRNAQWFEQSAEIRGWAKDVRRRSLVGYIGSSDDVAVTVHAGSHYRSRFIGMGIPLGEIEDRSVSPPAVMCWTDLPPNLREAATGDKNIANIVGDEFPVFVCEAPLGEPKRSDDAWQMRDEFLRLQGDNYALLSFLRRWGIWDHNLLRSSNLAPKATAGILNFVVPERVWELQRKYRDALIKPPSEWLSQGIDPFKGAYALESYPHFFVEHYQCRPAIEATITIDRLREVKFRKCKRPDCSNVFEIMSRHKRIYCGQPCAHLESVRKQRRKAARDKKRQKTHKGA